MEYSKPEEEICQINKNSVFWGVSISVIDAHIVGNFPYIQICNLNNQGKLGIKYEVGRQKEPLFLSWEEKGETYTVMVF